MGDGNKSRGKISLSGLTKGMSSSGSASGGFPSFRFSPENEEISEILQEVSSMPTFANTAAPDERLSESLPDSPKAGGDTSPIKEYLRKNWAHKWDKKSLSLDLDFKEKFLAAIDDKRKSIVSHFIPEETAGLIIPTSSSGSGIVTEHTGVVVSGESTPVNSYSNSTSTYNSGAISFDNSTQKVSANLSQSTGDDSSTTSEDFEEIGLDYLANMTTTDHADDGARDQVIPFTVGADKLQDTHSDLLLPRMDSRHYRETEFDDDEELEELKMSTVITNMATSIVVHDWTKYLLIVIVCGLFLPINALIAAILWFFVGVVVTIIIIQSLAERPMTLKTDNTDRSSVSITEVPNYSGQLTIPISPDISQLATDVSQGWLTEFDGEYDPINNNIRSNRIVFAKLEGSTLTISYPQSKYRIPKRRLWSDPPIPNVISFARHTVYNISGSEVFIAPERLAKRRAWNKKYPIGIRLPKYSLVSIHSPTEPAAKPLPAGSPASGEETSNHHPPRSSSPGVTVPPKHDTTDQHTDQPHSHKTFHKKGSIAREDVGDKVLYLFTRTDREKDDWYRRLVTAAVKKDHSYGTRLHLKEERILRTQYFSYMRSIIPSLNEFNESERKDAAAAQKSAQQPVAGPAPHSPDKKHKKTESKPKDEVPVAVPGPSTSKSPTTPRDNIDIENILTIPQDPVFLNALLGRVFFDFLRSQHWTSQVSSLIQKKLNYIRRPQFLGVLLVKDLDLGRSIPYFQRISPPVIDAQGLWVDCDITYEGNLTLILETKLDLMKLRRSPTNEDEGAHPRVPGTTGHTHHQTTTEGASSDGHGHTTRTAHAGNMYDSEADDSGESSEEEEYDPDDFILHENTDTGPQTENSALKPSRGTRFLRMAEKLANSNFVNDVKVIKKAIANVANTPLVLSVELKSCVGTLAFNIPHPPTDRVWIAFRTNPKIVLVCRPKFGERSLNLTHVTEFIRKKLLHEFQRVLVLPNMDDITIPLMEFKLPTS